MGGSSTGTEFASPLTAQSLQFTSFMANDNEEPSGVTASCWLNRLFGVTEEIFWVDERGGFFR